LHRTGSVKDCSSRQAAFLQSVEAWHRVGKPSENKWCLFCLAPSFAISRLTSRRGRAVPRMCGARSDRSIGHPVCRVRAPARISGISVKSVWLSSPFDSSSGPCIRTRKLIIQEGAGFHCAVVLGPLGGHCLGVEVDRQYLSQHQAEPCRTAGTLAVEPMQPLFQNGSVSFRSAIVRRKLGSIPNFTSCSPIREGANLPFSVYSPIRCA